VAPALAPALTMPPDALAPALTMPPDATFIERFNACNSPKQALLLVQDCGLMEADQLCALLAVEQHTDVNILGECLGHHHTFWQSVCGRFACHFEFSGLDVTSALRRYLWRFRLPGEAAPIGRILEGFALGYFKANPPSEGAPHTGAQSIGRTDWAYRGYFVRQPMVKKGQPCCVACGALDRADATLHLCTGCGVIFFCRRCRAMASCYGHAIGGRVGFGRACETAARIDGRLRDGHLQYASPIGYEKCHVGDADRGQWPRSASPIKSQDAVFVLAYAIVMLSTNLHNSSVRPADKMALHQFLQQCREQNDGTAFPGDYLESIYDAIRDDELRVMT